MHGFLGCIEEKPRAADEMSRWMAEWIRLEPKKQAFEIRRPPFLYVASTEPGSTASPMASDESGRVLAFRGFIAKDQLAEAGRSEPQADSEVAAALLGIYHDRGAEALAGLNGRYVACVWDPAKSRLELMNDILGLTPVFVWQRDGSFVFASNVWAIVCHPGFRKEIDPKGLMDLLLLNHQQGNRALLQDVSVLPPGSVTSFRDGKMTSRVVRNLVFSDERWHWSIEKTAEKMYSLLVQSLNRRVHDGAEVLLPLSGGFDSRVLLGFLLERPMKVKTITQRQHGLFAEDTRYAKRLARVAGTSHKTVPLPDSFLAQYRRKSVAINGGLCDIQPSRYLSLLDQSDRIDLPVVSAHLGGELTCRFQVPDTAFATADEQFEAAFRGANSFRFSREVLQEVMGNGVSADLPEEAVKENRRFFMSQDGPFFHRYYHWDLLLSRRRYICLQLLYMEQFTSVVAPFYDLDFVDFICSLPFAVISQQHAYRTMLRQHFPALAKIPNTNDLPVLTSTKEVLRDCAASQYRRFVQRPLHRLLRLRRWVGHPMEQIGFALRGGSRSVLEHILQNRDRIAPYLNPDKVQQALDRQLGGDSSGCMGLLGLSTFVTALEFLDDPYAALRAWQDDTADG